MKIRHSTILHTTVALALCCLASAGANAQVQFNSLMLANGTVTLCTGMDATVNIIGTASTDGSFFQGISQDAFGMGNPVVDSWNTFLQPVGGLSSFGPGILATYVVPAGTPNGVYSDNLYFISQDSIGFGATITPFTITVINIVCSPGTPEPGNPALLAGLGVTGAAFLVRRRRTR